MDHTSGLLPDRDIVWRRTNCHETYVRFELAKRLTVVSHYGPTNCALFRSAALTCQLMSATRDQIDLSSIGIQSIVPTTGTSRRVTKRQPDEDRSTDDGRTKSDQESPSPHPPATGKLVDKTV